LKIKIKEIKIGSPLKNADLKEKRRRPHEVSVNQIKLSSGFANVPRKPPQK
jgi:hypothetical protein